MSHMPEKISKGSFRGPAGPKGTQAILSGTPGGAAGVKKKENYWRLD